MIQNGKSVMKLINVLISNSHIEFQKYINDKFEKKEKISVIEFPEFKNGKPVLNDDIYKLMQTLIKKELENDKIEEIIVITNSCMVYFYFTLLKKANQVYNLDEKNFKKIIKAFDSFIKITPDNIIGYELKEGEQPRKLIVKIGDNEFLDDDNILNDAIKNIGDIWNIFMDIEEDL